MRQHAAAGLCRDAKGTSAIEFAIALPLLIVLMLGVTALGQAIYAMASVQSIVERSARTLMIDGAVTGVQLEELVRSRLAHLGDLEVAIDISDASSDVVPVTHVTAAVTYPVTIPLLPDMTLNYTIRTLVPRPF